MMARPTMLPFLALVLLTLGPRIAWAQLDEGFYVTIPPQGDQLRLDMIEAQFRIDVDEPGVLQELCVYADVVAGTNPDGSPRLVPFEENGVYGWRITEVLSGEARAANYGFRARYSTNEMGRMVRFDLEPQEQDCVSGLADGAQFRIRVAGCGGAPAEVGVEAACIEAYRVPTVPDRGGCPPMFDDGSRVEPAQDGEFYPAVSNLSGGAAVRQLFRCKDQQDRPAIHAAFVVDTSGSMGGRIDNGDDPPRSKAQLVTQAIRTFIRVWAKFQTANGDPGDPGNPNDARDDGAKIPDDRIGVVLFNGGSEAESYDRDFCDARVITGLDDQGLPRNTDQPSPIGPPDEDGCAIASLPWCTPAHLLRNRLHSGRYMRQFLGMCRDLNGWPCTYDEIMFQQDRGRRPWCGPIAAGESFPHSGATSIGDGLRVAIGPEFLQLRDYDPPALATAVRSSRRNIIVLFSDGAHNTPCDYSFDPKGTLTLEHDPQRCDLPLAEREPLPFRAPQTGQPIAVLHTVVVGPSSADEHRERMQTEALSTGGSSYFINEHNAAAIFMQDTAAPVPMGEADAIALTLQEYFLDILQNALRFNTWHQARRMRVWVPPNDPQGNVGLRPVNQVVVQGGDPEADAQRHSQFYVPATAKAVSVVAMWDASDGALDLEVYPPRSNVPIEASGQGLAQMTYKIENGRRFPNEPWDVRLRRVGDGDGQFIPVTVIAFVDHFRMTPTFDITGTLEPERPLAITAKLQTFGNPVRGLDGDRAHIFARVRRVLTAEASALLEACARDMMQNAMNGGRPDPGSRRSELFRACYEAHAGEMTNFEWSAPIRMRDDGQGGDEQAGDGVYGASFVPSHAGEHEFSIVVDAKLPPIGWTSLHYMKTLNIKQVPVEDPNDSAMMSLRMRTMQQEGAATMPIAVMPRDEAGDLLGPGLDGRLWLRLYRRDEGRDYDVTDIMMHGSEAMNGSYHAELPLDEDGLAPRAEVLFIDKPVGYSPDVPMDVVEQSMRAQLRQMDLLGRNSQKLGRLVVLMRLGMDEAGAEGGCEGCSSSPGTAPVWLLLGAVLLIGARRRRRT